MIKLVDLLNEITTPELNDKEQQIVDDILSLEEAINFQNVMDKVKSYAKKGLVTTAILTSLLSNDAFSQSQKDQIRDAAKTEQSVQNELVNIEEFKELIKDEDFEPLPGSPSVKQIPEIFKNVKIYRAVGQTQAAAMQSAMQKAKNPIQSYKFSRTVRGNIEVLIAVPSK